MVGVASRYSRSAALALLAAPAVVLVGASGGNADLRPHEAARRAIEHGLVLPPPARLNFVADDANRAVLLALGRLSQTQGAAAPDDDVMRSQPAAAPAPVPPPLAQPVGASGSREAPAVSVTPEPETAPAAATGDRSSLDRPVDRPDAMGAVAHMGLGGSAALAALGLVAVVPQIVHLAKPTTDGEAEAAPPRAEAPPPRGRPVQRSWKPSKGPATSSTAMPSWFPRPD